MSRKAAEKGLEMMRKGLADKIIFSTAYTMWEKEAELKKDLAVKYGVRDDLVEIIPAVTDSYDEAEKLRELIHDSGVTLILVAQKYHARRAASILKRYFSKVEVVKVATKIERQMDPSWLKNVLTSSTKLNFIVWNWFFLLIGPIMAWRQMKKEKGKRMN
jgi:uncharacterized SAM-binding protein YcdF (DUF218 family)